MNPIRPRDHGVTRRNARARLLIIVLLCAVPHHAAWAGQPVIELVTMGPGDDVFSRFGHAALCVRWQHADRCYNYGTANFATPVPLTWAFLRGRAQFWLSTISRDHLVTAYRAVDRTVYVQTLPLADRAASELARRVARDLAPGRRFYRYHHFADNCSTRLRDHIDAVTGGRLRTGGGVRFRTTYRALVREGLLGEPGLLMSSELLLGRALDVRPTLWEAMFHPDVLRAEISRRLGAKPEVVVRRHGQAPRGERGAGERLLIGGAILLGALVLATARARWPRLGRGFAGLVLGFLGITLVLLAVFSALPELRANELLLVFLPTDLGLGLLSGSRLRVYLRARLVLLVAVAAASLAGLFDQPLWAPLVLAALPLGAAAFVQRRNDSR